MAVKTVAILSPGEMGAAVGKVLHESGLEVITCLEGRSEQTRRRAGECGFAVVSDLEEIAGSADLILSILVPAEAAEVARSVACAMQASDARPTYADCNAVSPQTARALEPLITEAGGTFADAGIIGGPPRDGYAPRFYASGPGASTLAELGWSRDRRGPGRRGQRSRVSDQDVLRRHDERHHRLADRSLGSGDPFGSLRGAARRTPCQPASSFRSHRRIGKAAAVGCVPVDWRDGRDSRNVRIRGRHPRLSSRRRRCLSPCCGFRFGKRRRPRSRRGLRRRQNCSRTR